MFEGGIREEREDEVNNRPARREEDAATGDEPYTAAVRRVRAAGGGYINEERRGVDRWPELGNGVTAVAGARKGRGSGGGSCIRWSERLRWPEPWEGGVAVVGARGGRGGGGGGSRSRERSSGGG
uniref:Uncharacterized protein n=1 Tax=Oryza sativa subsp. japonica TaxID=39947 RepID=Q6K541_ORYSJ|nr:hypothetical protein [Oryza sativa Japonica Group]BAD19763.1 hypothetical protein [Oryza sativa Japonica Group]